MSQSAKMLTSFLGVVLLALPAYVRADETKGTVKSYDAAKHEIVVKGILENSVYDLNKSTVISLDGAVGSLANLKEGDQAVITYTKTNGRLVANEVRGLRNCQEATGTASDVFPEKREITLKGIVKNSTYELNKDGVVWLNGNRAALADVRAGDSILVTYQQRADHLMATCIRATRK
jgi:hypothetical protein